MRELLSFPDNARFRVNGILYKISTDTPEENDFVIDLMDGCTGTVDMIKDDRCAVADYSGEGGITMVAEVGIPLTRIRKLIVDTELIDA